MAGSRPFDVRPTIAILLFSLALSAGMILVNSAPSEDLLGAASASRVDTDQGSSGSNGDRPAPGIPTAGRDLQSPNDNFVGAGRTVVDGAANDVVSNEGVPNDGVAQEDGAEEPTSGEDNTQTEPRTTTTSTAAAPANASPIASTTTRAPIVTTTRQSSPRVTTTTAAATTTTRRPTTTTTRPPTTTTAAPTTTRPPSSNGRFTVAQVIDGTIGAGDGSNPNEEAPMGRHDASLYLPQAWNWAQGPSRNGAWGQLGTGSSRFVEWRCAVIPENGHNPDVPFRINIRSGAYYQFVNGNWNKAFDVDLTSGHRGAYLGNAGVLNNDPFSSGSHGAISWRREADGSFSAPWNSSALMMHLWAGQRRAPASGQTAEFLTSEVRLQQPDGQTVDLSRVHVLFQCGVDYYNSTGGQGTKVPGPGIGKYQDVTTGWTPSLWVTLPNNTPAGSVGDFREWLEANLPPNVRP